MASNSTLSPEGFYAEALSQAERLRLPRARQVEGLDEEIALLRLRLLALAQREPQRLDLLLKGMNTLLRLVATKYRLSPKAGEDLGQALAQVLTSISTQLGLGEEKP
ncbi:MAG: hypothetical protein NZ951_02515 [Dehalococcoidia bacterium]|nr:hypothetical protein [Dehalococcoidia bacterium]MDW8119833.1 hypothetical protein [Chloroflexota bacterium]